MKTGSPVKTLLRSYSRQTASWLLKVAESRIYSVEELSPEIHTQAVRADLLLKVEFDDGKLTLLHIEIQGKYSDVSMELRELGYTYHIAKREQLTTGDSFCSVVIYVGNGAGAKDNGEYLLSCPLGSETLRLHYHVIRLWEIEAETLLALDNAALLALIGQTKMNNPGELIPQVVKKIQALVPKGKDQAQLLSLFAVLAEGKEINEMIEAVLEKLDVDWLNTPFAQRILAIGKEEGKVEGKEEGKEEGLLEGLEVVLEHKFGTKGLLLMPELRNIKDLNILKLVYSKLISVNTTEELRLVYSQSSKHN